MNTYCKHGFGGAAAWLAIVATTVSWGALSPRPSWAQDRRLIAIISDTHFGLGKAGGRWHPTEDARWTDEFQAFLAAVDEHAAIRRSFRKASIAVLNGCGTAPNEAGTLFVNELNACGVESVIGATTSVSGRLAGDFLACLAHALDQNSRADAGSGMSVGEAYTAALRCAADREWSPSHRWGAKALAYALLGNPNLRFCVPPWAQEASIRVPGTPTNPREERVEGGPSSLIDRL